MSAITSLARFLPQVTYRPDAPAFGGYFKYAAMTRHRGYGLAWVAPGYLLVRFPFLPKARFDRSLRVMTRSVLAARSPHLASANVSRREAWLRYRIVIVG